VSFSWTQAGWIGILEKLVIGFNLIVVKHIDNVDAFQGFSFNKITLSIPIPHIIFQRKRKSGSSRIRNVNIPKLGSGVFMVYLNENLILRSIQDSVRIQLKPFHRHVNIKKAIEFSSWVSNFQRWILCCHIHGLCNKEEFFCQQETIPLRKDFYIALEKVFRFHKCLLIWPSS
jgi:hypothetical protein